MFDIVIIGAGIVGAMLARKLSQYELKILVIEKENDVANVTTMANSAIIHSGYDPLPNSLKAKLNVLGNKQFDEIAKQLDVKFSRIGSLTLAFDEKQLETLKELQQRGKENQVETFILNKEETLKIEPNINDNVIGSLFAPTAGIIDPFNLCVHAMENACENGVILHLEEEVIDIKKEDNNFKIITNKDEYLTSIVINASGYNADDIAKKVEDIDWSINPRKGQYFVLDHFDDNFVNHVIFPLPSEKGKGVLVSKTTSNNYIVGPSSEPCLKDDFSCDKLTLDNVRNSAKEMVKNIPFNQTIRIFSGIRATSSRHDFIIEPAKKYPNFINIAGIESPGLVSSPAIADYVITNYISKLINLVPNKNFNPYVRPYVHFLDLSIEKQNELIKKDKDFSKLICNCEKVTLGEIKDVLNRYVKPSTLKGVKKRTRAGFGKCQSGFCQSNIIDILSTFYQVDKTKILYDKINSNILFYKTKVGENND